MFKKIKIPYTILFISIFILIIIIIFQNFQNREMDNYLNNPDFIKSLNELSNSINNTDSYNLELEKLYKIRKDLLSKWIITWYNSYSINKIYSGFNLKNISKKCYIYEFNLKDTLNRWTSIIWLKNFSTQKLNSWLNCKKGEDCFIYLTEKWILPKLDNYTCE